MLELDQVVWLAPLLLLPIVGLFAFSGCTDPGLRVLVEVNVVFTDFGVPLDQLRATFTFSTAGSPDETISLEVPPTMVGRLEASGFIAPGSYTLSGLVFDVSNPAVALAATSVPCSVEVTSMPPIRTELFQVGTTSGLSCSRMVSTNSSVTFAATTQTIGQSDSALVVRVRETGDAITMMQVDRAGTAPYDWVHPSAPLVLPNGAYTIEWEFSAPALAGTLGVPNPITGSCPMTVPPSGTFRLEQPTDTVNLSCVASSPS